MSKTITILFMMLALASSSENLRRLQTPSTSGGTITSVSTGQVLVVNVNPNPGFGPIGTPMVAAGPVSVNDTWIFTAIGEDNIGFFYNIQNSQTGLCLFGTSGSLESLLNVGPCNQNAISLWYLIPAGNADNIVNQANALCLDIQSNIPAFVGAVPVQNTCNSNSASQQWTT